jgi:long-subunit acyl-CoA synthetase (AMP-forming)
MGAGAIVVAAATTPVLTPPASYAAAFQATVARVPDRVALRTIRGATTLTWRQYAAGVQWAAGALHGLGVGRGDRVAIVSRNRPELAIADVAALHLGASTVVAYVASPRSALEYVLRDCRPRVLVIEPALQPRLAGIGAGVCPVVPLDSLAALPTPPGFDFESAWRSVEGEDEVSVLYTSGTTGRLKGVRWRHREALEAMRRFDLLQPEPDGIRDISAGPFAHLTERGAGHWRSLLRGTTRTFCPDPAQLGAALLDARPTYLFGPPRLWQGLRRQLEDVVADPECPPRARLAGLGLDRLNRALTAAAPCPAGVFEYFGAAGIELGEFYGMTETSAATMTRPGGEDMGTVGELVPGYEIRVAAGGEVLIRSDSMAIGYLNQPGETSATFAADGWVRTGDVGVVNSRGQLCIVDRRKEILIPDHGHNVAPAPIEAELKDRCPLIAQVCLIGDARPHVAALITVDPPDRAVDPEARALIDAAVAAVNTRRDRRERIGSYAVLTESWCPGDELTETLKLRRQQILAKYSRTVDELYAEAPPSDQSGVTLRHGGPGPRRPDC